MKSFKHKKMFLSLSVVTTISLVTLISCGTVQNIDFSTEAWINNFSEKDWEYANTWAVGKLIKWSDGDTIEVSMKIENKGETLNRRIRIEGLDTPESRRPDPKNSSKWIDTPEPEVGYAKAATKFAETLIPQGTEIKIWLPGTKGQITTDTYNRVIGSIFYGENFSKSYVIEAIAAGWSIPEMNVGDITEYYTSAYVLAKQAALAFNDAWRLKKGIHRNRDQQSFNYLNDVYKQRGVGDSLKYSSFFIHQNHPASDAKNNYWILKK